MTSIDEIRRKLIRIGAALVVAMGLAFGGTALADDTSNNGGNNNDGDGIINTP